MRRRQALVVGLAGLTAACTRPAPEPTPTVLQPTSVASPTAPAQPTAAPAAVPTAAATPLVPVTAANPTAVRAAETQVDLDIHLWNGDAEVQLDGRTIEPGHISVPRGPHQVAALVDGEVAALA